jgi:hypothetical protein
MINHKKVIKTSLILFLIFSCSKNTDKELFKYSSNSHIESILGITFDEDIEELVDDAFSNDLKTSKIPKKRFKNNKYGSCASIYVDEENNTRTITFDDDCIGNRGQIRSGSIIVTHSKKKNEIGSFRQIDFENFYLNDIKIQGIRKHEIMDIEQGVSKTIQMNLENGKMTFPDGSFSTRSKLTTKFVTYDNNKQISTSITGNSSGFDSSGSLFQMKITSPILFLKECLNQLNNKKGIVPVSGIKSYTKDENEIIIDFGDGRCDFFADITKEGVTETIDLRKVYRKKPNKN